jgi:hypothetical protein
MTRQQEQIANHSYVVRRTSANNGLPYRQQQQVVEPETDEYEDVWPPRMPNSAIRYTIPTTQPPVIRSGNRRYVIHNSPPPQQQRTIREEEAAPRPRRRIHWSLVFGIGMAAMLTLWVLGTILVAWWSVTQDDWHYGRPRTFQTDAVVGHNNDNAQSPSHFIALNFRSHIEIIEFPAGDTTKAKIYQGLPLYGDGEELAVVTLSFKDINGDRKPDMIISVANTHIAYLNDSGQFRPLKPGEHVSQY